MAPISMLHVAAIRSCFFVFISPPLHSWLFLLLSLPPCCDLFRNAPISTLLPLVWATAPGTFCVLTLLVSYLEQAANSRAPVGDLGQPDHTHLFKSHTAWSLLPSRAANQLLLATEVWAPWRNQVVAGPTGRCQPKLSIMGNLDICEVRLFKK